MESIKIPDYNTIITKCVMKVIEKHKEYQNSWVYNLDLDGFWTNRLKGEITEILKSINKDESSKAIQSEIVDAINILCMMYHEVDEE